MRFRIGLNPIAPSPECAAHQYRDVHTRTDGSGYPESPPDNVG